MGVDGDHLAFQRRITLVHVRRVETESGSGVSGDPRGDNREEPGCPQLRTGFSRLQDFSSSPQRVRDKIIGSGSLQVSPKCVRSEESGSLFGGQAPPHQSRLFDLSVCPSSSLFDRSVFIGLLVDTGRRSERQRGEESGSLFGVWAPPLQSRLFSLSVCPSSSLFDRIVSIGVLVVTGRRAERQGVRGRVR